ncbi:MAG: hypothetical protein QOD70_875 [Frankiales bacterium]|nr:hypothetical protein [Frankiales bacterium]
MASPRALVRSLSGCFALLCAALLAMLALSSAPAQAAAIGINQCNGIGPSASGATTAMTCTVQVVNTISGGTVGSTTTVTRQCALGPCPPGNGTFTTTSTSLVTSVDQCNGSDNDAAHPITCSVTILNDISSDTPGALPLSAATVNQCVGSGNGGGGTTNCSPYPANTTGATVTQCNGSTNGGGATVSCDVASASTISAAVPITVNQCNGSGNPGGSTVSCSVSILTRVIAVSATPTPSASPAAIPSDTPSTPVPASGPSPSTVTDTAQITHVPAGGVQTGGGSTAGRPHTLRSVLAVGLLLVAGMNVALLRRRGHRRVL